MKFPIVLGLCLQLGVTGIIAEDKTLTVMFLSSWFSGDGDLALELINNRSDLLPGYKLETSNMRITSRQDIGQATKAFIDQVSSPPTKIAILGPSYTSEAAVIADVAKHFNLVEVGYSITSPVLSDKKKYPLFARTVESTHLNSPAIIKILKKFNWRKVAKIVLDYGYIIPTANDIQTLLDADNFTTLASATYSSDPSPQVQQVKDSGARIILSYTTSVPGFPRMFCRAYHEGYYGPHYQWLHWSGMHGILSQLNEKNKDVDGCDLDMMKAAMEGVLYFTPITSLSQEPKTTEGVSGYTLDGLKALKEERSYSSYIHDKAFDAVWAIALALNSTMSRLPEGTKLEDFSYTDSNMSAIIFEELTRTKFYGASGSVEFDESGDRNSMVVVSQIQDGEGVQVGIYNPMTGELTMNEHNQIRFQGNSPPRDSVVIVSQLRTTSRPLFILFCTCAALGLLYTTVCVVFNVYYRNTRLVKLSSPRINNMIAAGCGLAYLSVVLIGLDDGSTHDQDWLCSLRAWALVYGFTFSFGSMFAKTWRVHVLFTNKKLTRKIVKDLHLFGMVICFLLVDTVLLLLWLAIDPLRWQLVKLETYYDEHDLNTLIQPEVYKCSSKHSQYWSGALYGFKALLLIFGIFFAWETRKLRIEALNDSKQIGICVYNIMIMSIVSVPLVSLLSEEQLNISYGVISIAVLVCSTTTLVLVFGSKMFLIYTHGAKVDDVAVLPFAATLKGGGGGTMDTSYRADRDHGSIIGTVDIRKMKPTIPSVAGGSSFNSKVSEEATQSKTGK